MTDQTTGLDVSVRGNVTRNSRGYTQEHTVSVQGRMRVEADAAGTVRFWFDSAESPDGAIELDMMLDALHQEAARANAREIERQQREQLAAIPAGA